MKVVIHDTHEAIKKEGGIGAVIEGLLDCEELSSYDQIVMGAVSCDEIKEYIEKGSNRPVDSGLMARIKRIENRYNIELHYGFHTVLGQERELLLVNLEGMDKGLGDNFKARVHDFTDPEVHKDSLRYALDCWRYEYIHDCNEHVLRSLPLSNTLKAVLAHKKCKRAVLVSHEYMGSVGLIASAMDSLRPADEVKRVFWAHENPFARNLTEEFELGNGRGHDLMFYNVLDKALSSGMQVRDIPEFWNKVEGNYRYNMIMAAMPFIDNLIAVGDYTKKEFVFGGAPEEKISVVPNGIPVEVISVSEKNESVRKLRQYSCNLGLFDKTRPDYIFTQVARCVPSKGFWRSAGIMHHIDNMLKQHRETALLFLVVNAGRREIDDILEWEKNNWPIEHTKKDLKYYDEIAWEFVRNYNRKHKNTQIVLLNQFVTDSKSCGTHMPRDMSFMDFRYGTHVELNPAIYEPFGISCIEPLPYGALIVISSVCGCASFLREYEGHDNSPVIIGDYVPAINENIEDLLTIGHGVRDKTEPKVNRELAYRIYTSLKDREFPMEARIQTGYSIAENFTWNRIARDNIVKIFG